MKLRENANEWCLRYTVYEPIADRPRGVTHRTTRFEGAVANYFAEFLKALPMGAHRLGPEDVRELERMTQKMRGK